MSDETPDELYETAPDVRREALLRTIHCGVPPALDGVTLASKVIAEHGKN